MDSYTPGKRDVEGSAKAINGGQQTYNLPSLRHQATPISQPPPTQSSSYQPLRSQSPEVPDPFPTSSRANPRLVRDEGGQASSVTRHPKSQAPAPSYQSSAVKSPPQQQQSPPSEERPPLTHRSTSQQKQVRYHIQPSDEPPQTLALSPEPWQSAAVPRKPSPEPSRYPIASASKYVSSYNRAPPPPQQLEVEREELDPWNSPPAPSRQPVAPVSKPALTESQPQPQSYKRSQRAPDPEPESEREELVISPDLWHPSPPPTPPVVDPEPSISTQSRLQQQQQQRKARQISQQPPLSKSYAPEQRDQGSHSSLEQPLPSPPLEPAFTRPRRPSKEPEREPSPNLAGRGTAAAKLLQQQQQTQPPPTNTNNPRLPRREEPEQVSPVDSTSSSSLSPQQYQQQPNILRRDDSSQQVSLASSQSPPPPQPQSTISNSNVVIPNLAPAPTQGRVNSRADESQFNPISQHGTHSQQARRETSNSNSASGEGSVSISRFSQQSPPQSPSKAVQNTRRYPAPPGVLTSTTQSSNRLTRNIPSPPIPLQPTIAMPSRPPTTTYPQLPISLSSTSQIPYPPPARERGSDRLVRSNSHGSRERGRQRSDSPERNNSDPLPPPAFLFIPDHIFLSLHGSHTFKLAHIPAPMTLQPLRETVLPLWERGVEYDHTTKGEWVVKFGGNPWCAGDGKEGISARRMICKLFTGLAIQVC
jgi:hypothetical protein